MYNDIDELEKFIHAELTEAIFDNLFQHVRKETSSWFLRNNLIANGGKFR
jgi:hypothetical protein